MLPRFPAISAWNICHVNYKFRTGFRKVMSVKHVVCVPRYSNNYDVGLGVMTSAIDFNQNTTYFNFDTFGRIVSITKPYDTVNLPTAAFTYMLQSPASGGQTVNYIETDLREVAGQAGTFSSREFFDGMGRKMMTRTQSETNGIVVVNDATLFNQRRNLWHSFLPYFEAGTLAFNPINPSGSYVETDYDALGRETVKSQPPTPPETYRAFSQTTYGPLTRLVEDEEQTQPTSPHFGAGMFYVEDGLRGQNGHGRLRQVEEIVKISDTGQVTGNTNVWLTQYSYDTLDDFLGYIDSQGNQKFFQYDALMRKTFMNDPDRGIMQWNYDPASNVTNTVDAKGQQIVYAYDGVNRLQTENYLDGNPLPQWRSSTPNGTNAAIVYASSGSTNTFTFGPADRGRVERVDLSVSPPLTFAQWLAQYGLPTNSLPDSDPNHKGMTLMQQFIAGLNPNDPNSLFQFVGIQPIANGVQVLWSSVADITYTLQQGTSLDGPFTTVQTNIIGTPGTNTFTIPMPTNGSTLFLRVLVNQPG